MRRMTLPVLMYHHIERLPLDPAPRHADSYLPRADFARQLDDLQRRGFRTLTLAEACARCRDGARQPRRTVVLTFDDGCRCFAEHAWPELRARRMTATVFAVAGCVGASNRWDEAAGERTETLLDGAALRQLAAAGAEVGSHGSEHLDLTLCDDPARRRETEGSRALFASILGEPPRTFCYPYGHVDERSRRAVEDAGYLAAVSIQGQRSSHPHDLYALPRMIIRPHDSRLEFRLKTSGLYPAYSRLPRLGLLAALRRNRKERAER